MEFGFDRYLVGEESDVFVERGGGADVNVSRRRTVRNGGRRQLALVEDQSQQRKQRVTAHHRHHRLRFMRPFST